MPSTAHNVETSLSDLLETALKEGSQIVSRNGVETAVIVPIAEWKRSSGKSESKPDTPRRSLKEILLDPDGPRFEDIVPPRETFLGRPIIKFE